VELAHPNPNQLRPPYKCNPKITALAKVEIIKTKRSKRVLPNLRAAMIQTPQLNSRGSVTIELWRIASIAAEK